MHVNGILRQAVNSVLRVRNKMLMFLKHDNINDKTRCKIYGQDLNSKGASLFHEILKTF